MPFGFLYLFFFHFFPLKGLEKETTQTAELLSHFYLFKLYQNNRTYYETLFFILNTTFFCT